MRKKYYIVYKWVFLAYISFTICFLPKILIKSKSAFKEILSLDDNSVKYNMSELMVDNNDKPQFRHENNVFGGTKLKTYDKVYIQGNFLSGHKIDKNTKQGKWLTVYPAKGRLGNQMFQIASVLGIADKFNYRPFIPLTNFDIYSVFEMPNPTKITIDLSESLKYQESNISTHEECDVTTYSDLSFLKGDMNWTLDGYLQSFKYFWQIQNVLRKLFTFKSDIMAEARRFIDESAPSDTVKIGIHVRRGDFLSDYHINLGRITPEEDYYKKAMEMYSLNYKNATFYVFSNDINWCQGHLQHNGHKVVFSPYTQPGYDLAVMSLCDHMIISVGTFGWWGGWLAGGSVIYFNGYPKPGSEISKYFVKDDFYPPFWIGIT